MASNLRLSSLIPAGLIVRLTLCGQQSRTPAEYHQSSCRVDSVSISARYGKRRTASVAERESPAASYFFVDGSIEAVELLRTKARMTHAATEIPPCPTEDGLSKLTARRFRRVYGSALSIVPGRLHCACNRGTDCIRKTPSPPFCASRPSGRRGKRGIDAAPRLLWSRSAPDPWRSRKAPGDSGTVGGCW
jgi:hypothetical protein